MSDDEATRPIDLDALRAAGAQEAQEEPEEPAPASATRIDVARPVTSIEDHPTVVGLDDATQTSLPSGGAGLPGFGEHTEATLPRFPLGSMEDASVDSEETMAIVGAPVHHLVEADDVVEADDAIGPDDLVAEPEELSLDSGEIVALDDSGDLVALDESGDLEALDDSAEILAIESPEDLAPMPGIGAPAGRPAGRAEDDDTRTQLRRDLPAAPAPAPEKVRREPPPPGPRYQPPPPARTPPPAYAVDPDADEEQLQDEESFNALLDLYRMRLSGAETPSAKAGLLHKIGSVLERLDLPQEAFSALVEAFDLRPMDDDLVASLERVGRAVGRIGELAERAMKSLHTADPELRLALLGHLVYWHERVLGRPQEAEAFVAEIARVDKSHPIILQRSAQIAAANGDVKTQRDLLTRALDRTARRDERVMLHLLLAGSYAGTPDALRHYETALSYAPTSIVALQGIEHIGRAQEKLAQVEWALERQIEVAETSSERASALLSLAQLHETKYLRRDTAAEMLERVLDIEPTNPAALESLERCYHAMRRWAELSRVLRARANITYDEDKRVELLATAAEVYEAKLGDPAQAIEVLRDILHRAPKHRRALSDLARLYEKLGDWGNVATYKARLAELASTKRQASRELVALGDFLSAPERDAIAARLQYERAVTVDPSNVGAWEALQRVATEAGDEGRVVACLESRAKHTDGPQKRAAVLVELAELHTRRGDERAARDALEAAVKADPTNETAAAAMLDEYARAERWREAAPLAELLVNAAVRDQDAEALFSRLRLSTRIAAALGDAERAMTSALRALDARPDDPSAQADLVAVCSQCRDKGAVVARAKSALARIASGGQRLPAKVLIGLAQVARDSGDVDEAVHTLERALREEPDDPDLVKELSALYLVQGDYPRACKLKVDMARNATSADARFALLVEAGEVWAKKACELEKAATVFEEARRIKPLDHWLLHTLMWLYGELDAWDSLSSVLEAITKIQESPERKAKSLVAMAHVVRDKMHDPVRAADLFDQVLDIDKTRLEIFEQLVRALTEAKDWERLELSYRKMIARVKDDGAADLRFALFHQLGLIYRDRLGDASRAYEALEAAGRIRPDDTVVRKIVTELLVVTDNLDSAVDRTLKLIERDPHRPALYAELYDLFLRQKFFDKAWCAVNVLASLDDLSPEQQRFHEDYAPMDPSEVPGQIAPPAWRSHILHADLDPTLTSLFGFMTPAVARMRHAQLRPELAVGRPFTPKHSRLYEPIRKTFANAAEILGVPAPELLLGDAGAPVPFAPALAPYGAILVSVPALEARADSLVYLVGKRLAEQRPELAARAFFPSMSDLTGLLAAAVRVSRREGAQDAAGAALDASMAAFMTPDEREGIRSIVMQATMQGGLVDVKRWSQAADLSSTRAGLLLAGDVAPARRVILAEPQSTADLPPREKIGELLKFATSDLYSDLRGAIGVAVEG